MLRAFFVCRRHNCLFLALGLEPKCFLPFILFLSLLFHWTCSPSFSRSSLCMRPDSHAQLANNCCGSRLSEQRSVSLPNRPHVEGRSKFINVTAHGKYYDAVRLRKIFQGENAKNLPENPNKPFNHVSTRIRLPWKRKDLSLSHRANE